MRVKLVKRADGPLRVIDVDTGETVEGIHDITYEATCLGSLLTIHIIDFDIDVEDNADIHSECLSPKCRLNINGKVIEGGAIITHR